jgi:Luciferase-like monooxygenase
VTAQAAAALHLLTRGRAILGIGTGEREGNEPFGVDWTKPVARFEEALATIRALWDSGGELVNRESPFFPLRNAVFDLPPYRGNGRKFGSLLMGLACYGPPGATQMRGFPRSHKRLTTTRNVWNSSVPRLPTPAATRCRPGGSPRGQLEIDAPPQRWDITTGNHSARRGERYLNAPNTCRSTA